MTINSLSNKKIMMLKKLQNKKYRRAEKKFMVEGEHLVKEAYSSLLLEEIYILEGHDYDYDVTKYYITKEIMKKVTELESLPNVIGLCAMKENTIKGDKIIALDNIQDPGNLGTIIRNAVAFNIDTILASVNTVDLYNDKVLRSAQGMNFHINYITCDLKTELKKLKGNYKIYGTSLKEKNELSKINKTDKYILVLGNEGSGISDDIMALVDHNIYIKMNQKCESLNVSVASGIILYELDK